MPASKSKKPSVRITSSPHKHRKSKETSRHEHSPQRDTQESSNTKLNNERGPWYVTEKPRKDSKVHILSPTTGDIHSTLSTVTASSGYGPSSPTIPAHDGGAVDLMEKAVSNNESELDKLDISGFLTHAPGGIDSRPLQCHGYHRPSVSSVSSVSSSDDLRSSNNVTVASKAPPALIRRKVRAPSPPSAVKHCHSRSHQYDQHHTATASPPAAIPPLPQMPQPPPHSPTSPSPEEKKRQQTSDYPVYDHLAWTLSQPSPTLPPLYRTFPHLHHRLLLHLQAELCELEVHIRHLDAEIHHLQQQQQQQSQTQQDHVKWASRPSRHDADMRYLQDLHRRRDDIILSIQGRLKRYTEAISTFQQFDDMGGSDAGTHTAEEKKNALEEYKSWIAAIHSTSTSTNSTFAWLDKQDVVDIGAEASRRRRDDRGARLALEGTLELLGYQDSEGVRGVCARVIVLLVLVALVFLPSLIWRLGVVAVVGMLRYGGAWCVRLLPRGQRLVRVQMERWVASLWVWWKWKYR